MSILILFNVVSFSAHAEDPQILNFSPQGTVKDIRQVRAQFSESMVLFGDPNLAAPFTISCPEKGKGFWEDDKNWVYDFDHDLGAGVICRFNIRKDLKTISGKNLAGKSLFEFSTGGPAILHSSPYDGSSVEEGQYFALILDAAPNKQSVLNSAYFVVEGIEEKIPLEIVEGKEKDLILASEIKNNGYFQERSDSSVVMIVRAKRNFPPSKFTDVESENRDRNKIKLVWGKGIASLSGVKTDSDQILSFDVRPSFYATFSCERENKDSACVPITSPSLHFSSGVFWKDIRKIRLVAGKQTWKPEEREEHKDDDTTAYVNFPSPLPANTEFRIELPNDLRDQDGRVMINIASFPLKVKTDDYPPLAKFETKFGILELNAEPAIPLTLRNLEPALQSKMLTIYPRGELGKINLQVLRSSAGKFTDIIAWLKKMSYEDDSYEKRSTSIFSSDDKNIQHLELKKPNGSKSFEVVGVPVTKPGFYMMEVESPLLGQSLLRNKNSYFIKTSALVTNLSVHFKRGRESSLAWVTTLDKGEPAPDVSVAIRDCNGRILKLGRTDKHGIAMFNEEIVISDEDCRESGYRYSEYNEGFFVTAEKGADFSFVHSSWIDGIEPYRFQLRSERYTGPVIVHTVLDRTLLRADETVHMKHFFRKHASQNMAFVSKNELPKTLIIEHHGSSQKYFVPLKWDDSGTSSTEWKIPKEAKLGTYTMYLDPRSIEDVKKSSDSNSEDGEYDGEGDDYPSQSAYTSGQFRVEEFRIPTMKANVFSPAHAMIADKVVPIDVHVDYFSGGPANDLPVNVRYQIEKMGGKNFDAFDGFEFDLGKYSSSKDSKNQESKTVPTTLDKTGSSRVNIDLGKLEGSSRVKIEAEYSDPNGEIQTISSNFPVYESSNLVGIKTDGWMTKRDDFKFTAAVVDLKGKPVANAPVEVSLRQIKTYSHRKKIVGGFYAYENRNEEKDFGVICTGQTDAKGFVFCETKSPVAGDMILQAKTKDEKGRLSYTNQSVWLWDKEPWMFDVSNSDRIDLLPEQKKYEPGQTAKFQVRMPFAKANVLVTVEREGILDSFVKEIAREKPIIEVPIKKNYSPNVFVSAFLVRGRVGDVQPTAMVDLGKPAYKLGISEILVNWKSHELKVNVQPAKTEYKVRDRAKVKISVRDPEGKIPSKNSQVAIAVVDEALLDLKPNDSWKLLDAMMEPRGYEVNTMTAQMEVVGKRHFGLKAVLPGGGGGSSKSRELFDTLLFWKSNVQLDSKGEATIDVPLNDSLTSFKIAAVANADSDLFGTGYSSFQTHQDLSIFSGIPPVAREGDKLKLEMTLRNGMKEGMNVDISGKVDGKVVPLAEKTIRISGNESKKVVWNVEVPNDKSNSVYEFEAVDSKHGVSDRIKTTQQIKPVVPVEVIQATLSQVDEKMNLNVQKPQDGLPDRGGVKLSFNSSLTNGVDGIKYYMRNYPYSCLEQKISKIIVLEDEKAWKDLAKDLPAYLDSDGLAKYFPIMKYGSEILTSYFLSASNEAGIEIPNYVRESMISGLQKFIEGKIRTEYPFRAADLTFRKFEAMEALSRFDAVRPEYLQPYLNLEQVALWPTSAILDYYNVVNRMKNVPNRFEIAKQLTQILQSRLTFRGTIMKFSTEGNEDFWWLMLSGDVNSNRFLLSVIDDPVWASDIGKILRGMLDRQAHGHWDLTTANVWGFLAIKAFSKKFEKDSVKGKTFAEFDSKTSIVDWSKNPKGDFVQFPWQQSEKPSNVVIKHNGKGKPWVTVQSLAAIPLKEGFFKGYKIKKTVSAVQQKTKGKWTRGDVVRVQLNMDAQSDMGWLALSDPIPAGSTILGSGLGKDSSILTKSEKNSNEWDSQPLYIERSFDMYRAYYQYIPKGKWTVEYMYRINQSGELNLPPTRVEAMYSPEVFGQLPNSSMSVLE